MMRPVGSFGQFGMHPIKQINTDFFTLFQLHVCHAAALRIHAIIGFFLSFILFLKTK